MNTPICKNCIHYRQHYILGDQCCSAINCGHCVYPRRKHREPNHPACPHYVLQTTPPALPDRESVVRFLTTELLEYILRLGLPPEIQTEPSPSDRQKTQL